MTGFGNEFASEALPDALPVGQVSLKYLRLLHKIEAIDIDWFWDMIFESGMGKVVEIGKQIESFWAWSLCISSEQPESLNRSAK